MNTQGRVLCFATTSASGPATTLPLRLPIVTIPISAHFHFIVTNRASPLSDNFHVFLTNRAFGVRSTLHINVGVEADIQDRHTIARKPRT